MSKGSWYTNMQDRPWWQIATLIGVFWISLGSASEAFVLIRDGYVFVYSMVSNDYDYESAFERQVQTFAKPGDTLLAISTSGNSENILRAVAAAKAAGVFSIGLTGKGGGKLREACNLPIIVPSDETDRIQEAHITLIHIFVEIMES